MSERRRQSLSDQGRARWAALPEEVKAERIAKTRAAFEAKYPGRGAAYDELIRRLHAGEVREEPCDVCAGEARPMLRFEGEPLVAVVVGWRCYPCRKSAR